MSKSRKYVKSRAHFLKLGSEVVVLLGSDVGLFVCFSHYVYVSSSLNAYRMFSIDIFLVSRY